MYSLEMKNDVQEENADSKMFQSSDIKTKNRPCLDLYITGRKRHGRSPLSGTVAREPGEKTRGQY